MSIALREIMELLNMGRENRHTKNAQSSMQKQNCWEFIQCGREPGGKNADRLGICQASIETSANGLNGGLNGGRICWAISGTYCLKKVSGIFAKKILSCRSCIFLKKVKEEEGVEHYRQSIQF